MLIMKKDKAKFIAPLSIGRPKMDQKFYLSNSISREQSPFIELKACNPSQEQIGK